MQSAESITQIKHNTCDSPCLQSGSELSTTNAASSDEVSTCNCLTYHPALKYTHLWYGHYAQLWQRCKYTPVAKAQIHTCGKGMV